MQQPILVIMAAGMGSRFGGLKQIEPVSRQGEIILDFSLYDAMMAGFEKVVFIIKEENEQAFRALIDERAGKYLEVSYAFQRLGDLPAGYAVPENRVKPWGTCHAVWSARDLLDGNFAVINADDYYGPGAFASMYTWLETAADDAQYRYSMVGYRLANTLTENGHVARGVCDVTASGQLRKIVEHTKIMRRDGVIAHTEDDGATWQPLPEDATVSMNFWGFTPSFLREVADRFPAFLDRALAEDPEKGEYFLPSVVDALIGEQRATVQVLPSRDRWYGVTYREDKASVVDALQSMKDKGMYPEKLWK